MIPKIIHYCWLSGDPYPKLIQKCVDSWKKYLPDYEFVLWDTSRFDVNQTEWTREAFEKKKYASVADYVRFYALYNFGGIYLDTDVEVLKPFDDLLQQDYFFGYEYSGAPEAACVGAVKGIPWVKKCIDFYEKESFFKACDEGYFEQILAPHVMKIGFESCMNFSLSDDGKVHDVEGGKIYPYDWFSCKNAWYSGKILATANSYAVHHFNGGWFEKDVKIKRRITHIMAFFLGVERYKKLNRKIKKLLCIKRQDEGKSGE